MGNKLRHEGDEVRIKVIWPDIYIYIYIIYLDKFHHDLTDLPNPDLPHWKSWLAIQATGAG